MSGHMLKFVDLPQATPEKRSAETRRADFDEIYRDLRSRAPRRAQASPLLPVRHARICQVHCPLHNNIPDWLMMTAEGTPGGGLRAGVRRPTTFPEICGRICPQDRLCEGNCVIEQAGHGTVTIGTVENAT